MKCAIFFVFFLLSYAPLLAHECWDGPQRAPDNAIQRHNKIVEKYDLRRMEDQKMIKKFISLGLLVPITDHAEMYKIDRQIGRERRFARFFVNKFLEFVGRKRIGKFENRFKITSLVRDFPFQNKLKINGLSMAKGDNSIKASSHLTGATVDISTLGMKSDELLWMRKLLCRLHAIEAIDFWEEVKLNHFHIMVYPDFEEKIKKLSS